MKFANLDSQVSISSQITTDYIDELVKAGVQCIVCNRPNNEAADQEDYESIERTARAQGLECEFLPFVAGELTDAHVEAFASVLKKYNSVHAYCRTGNRSTQLWAATRKNSGLDVLQIQKTAAAVGFDVNAVIAPSRADVAHGAETSPKRLSASAADPCFDVVIVGAGSGGISAAASLLKRRKGLRIALIDTAEKHYYQPGWTMVGGGVFSAISTCRNMAELIPRNVSWIKDSVVSFSPAEDKVHLHGGDTVYYQHLIVCPGLTLNWSGIEGLEETLGKNGVTSNYRYDLAPYTWQLVQELNDGRALFTQPAMPIKCAGAPQKAMYLSADHWHRNGNLSDIDVHFYNAGGVLFGVEAYVPALQEYIAKYQVETHFMHNLVKIDGESKTAWFADVSSETDDLVETQFDMIHVCPPQVAPEFIRNSDLSDATGWLDVDPFSLQHKAYSNIWGLGDVINTANAKTMAAVRKQAPVVAQNICESIDGLALSAGYDGYGSCPLTVERGKIVLAEFGYGGSLLPTLPQWIIKGDRATRAAWILKKDILPLVYWHGMLKGHEWLAAPKKLKDLNPG